MNTNMKNTAEMLKYIYGLVPIIAGLDKFTNVLTDWSIYLSDSVASLLPVEAATFMMIVGIIEIIAGVLVFIRPKEGAYLVMGWLIAIALTLILSWHYVDIAVRDLVMASGAYALAQLYENKEHSETVEPASSFA